MADIWCAGSRAGGLRCVTGLPWRSPVGGELFSAASRPAAVVPADRDAAVHRERDSGPTIVKLLRKAHCHCLVPAESLGLLFAAADEGHSGGPVKIDLGTAAQALRLSVGASAGDRYVGVRH